MSPATLPKREIKRDIEIEILSDDKTIAVYLCRQFAFTCEFVNRAVAVSVCKRIAKDFRLWKAHGAIWRSREFK